MRAADKTEGMVFLPVWIVVYQDREAIGRNGVKRAEFDAVSGGLLNASFK